MEERDLRNLIEEVRSGKLSRRAFIGRMVTLGLTAPMASQLLMFAGIAQAKPPLVYKPTKRGGGGALKALWWQGATLLNYCRIGHETIVPIEDRYGRIGRRRVSL